jgi:hypothetical protein
MSKTVLVFLIGITFLLSAPAFATDGQILINQNTVMAAGGFPYQINQPGSYKLASDLVVAATGAIGIQVNVSNVSIDLNGFTVSGPAVCTGLGGAGISCTSLGGIGIFSDIANISVRNGTVTGFGKGISLTASNYLVEDTQAIANETIGIIVGDGSLVRRNSANYNGTAGILTRRSTVTENVANLNGQFGLEIVGGVIGSNTFELNGSNPPVQSSSAVSQNNNDCNGTAC